MNNKRELFGKIINFKNINYCIFLFINLNFVKKYNIILKKIIKNKIFLFGIENCKKGDFIIIKKIKNNKYILVKIIKNEIN